MADQVATVLDDGGGQHDVPEGRLTLGVGAPDGDRAFGLFREDCGTRPLPC